MFWFLSEWSSPLVPDPFFHYISSSSFFLFLLLISYLNLYTRGVFPEAKRLRYNNHVVLLTISICLCSSNNIQTHIHIQMYTIVVLRSGVIRFILGHGETSAILLQDVYVHMYIYVERILSFGKRACRKGRKGKKEERLFRHYFTVASRTLICLCTFGSSI